MITLGDIEEAQDVINRFDRRKSAGIRHTPLIASESLGDMANATLYFKAECLQKTGSFKVRGIVNTLVAEMGEEFKGILAVSSGNQGLAVAYVAALLGKRSLIVLPEGASVAKTAAIRSYGAEIAQTRAASFDDAMIKCAGMARERGYYFPDLFANARLIAGHGTIGLQILEDLPDVDAIVIPGGSGALAAGLATACKSVKSSVKVFVVGAQNSPCLLTAFQQRKPTVLSKLPETVCDGLRSPVVSGLVLDHILKHVDDIVSVSDEEVIGAMRLIWSHTKLLSETSGAVPLAALLAGRLPIKEGSKVVCLLTGGNIDLSKAPRYLTE